MAANNNPIEHGREACKLRELFKGRFSEEEAERLLASQGSLEAAAHFVMNGIPAEVRVFIHDRNNALLAELQRSSAEVAVELNRGIATSIRLFACRDCDFYWWRQVPARKEVSKCRRCRTKLDPVPRDQEWGLAEFECECGNVFKGSGWMNHTQSPCYECQSLAMPARIIPPTKDHVQTPRRKPHSCTGGNCHNRDPRGIQHDVCTHPRSITRKKVLYPSPQHLSTGSTVRTFMSQGDLAEDYQDLDPMPSIAEYDED